MNDINTTTAAASCPQCGQPNQCVIAAGAAAESCWCMKEPANPALVKRYADQQRCLCPKCANTSDHSTIDR